MCKTTCAGRARSIKILSLQNERNRGVNERATKI